MHLSWTTWVSLRKHVMIDVSMKVDSLTWVGIGIDVGNGMVGASAIVGCDAASNPISPWSKSVVLIAMNGKDTLAQQQEYAGSLAANGIMRSSFTQTGSTTTLTLTLNNTLLPPTLKFAPNGLQGGAVFLMLVHNGGDQTMGAHSTKAEIPIDFVVGVATTAPSEMPTSGPTTRAPTLKGQTASPTSSAPVTRRAPPRFVTPHLTADTVFSFNVTTAPNGAVLFVDFEVSFGGVGWLAVGVGTQMVGSKAVIGLDPASQSLPARRVAPGVGVYDMNGRADAETILLTTSSSQSTMSLSSFGISNASFVQTPTRGAVLRFTVTPPTQSPTFVLVPAGPFKPRNVSLIFAHGDGPSLTSHANWGFFTLDLNQAAASSTSSGFPPDHANGAVLPPPIVLDSVLVAHVLTALVAFVVLFPAGAAIPILKDLDTRPTVWLRAKRRWFAWHYRTQAVATVVALASIVLGFVHQDARGIPHVSKPHHQLGVAVLVGIVAQLVMAVDKVRPTRASPTKWVAWVASHRAVALFVLVGGVADILVGVTDNYTAYVGAAAVGLFPTDASTPLSTSAVVVGCAAALGVVGGLVGVRLWWHWHGRVVARRRNAAGEHGGQVVQVAQQQLPELVEGRGSGDDNEAPPKPPKPQWAMQSRSVAS